MLTAVIGSGTNQALRKEGLSQTSDASYTAVIGEPAFASRFWARVDSSADPDACWPWIGYVQSSGYAQWSVRIDGQTRTMRASRIAYALATGQLAPFDLQLDHRCHRPEECRGGPSCRHRRCCNPAHLEAVTPAENAARAALNVRRSSWQARKTRCPAGHPYDGANLYVASDGRRQCVACRTARNRAASRARNRARSGVAA